MVPEFLACVNVADVDFDHRGADARHCVTNGDAVMTQGAGDDDDRLRTGPMHLNRVDELAFMIRLQSDDLGRRIRSGSLRFQPGDNVGQGRAAVDSRFAGSEQIQIWTVEHQKSACTHL